MSDAAAATCCIAGCGPAGAVLGLLLARVGVDVLVLEKHADFLRDFRGDTIHPSTLEILDELGLAEQFLRLPHSEVRSLRVEMPGGQAVEINFGQLGGRFPYIAFVPQWDFLNFITQEAARYPNFRLVHNADVTDLIRDDGAVHGVRYRDGAGEHQVHATLTIGADGRQSVTRAAAHLPLVTTSPPMDVQWFRISRRPTDPENIGLRLAPGHIVVLFTRGDYWQVGNVIPKGADARVRSAGLSALRQSLAEVVPELADRVGELHDWEQVQLLTVRSDRLVRWYRPGYLAIGDAAHAMSPVGGVGINLAIQDAVEAGNRLGPPLLAGAAPVAVLARVQRRRELAVWIVQRLQTLIQEQLLRPTLSRTTRFKPPAGLRLVQAVPGLQALPARMLAYGINRPHVAQVAR